MPSSRRGTQQPRSIIGLTVTSVVPALQLDPSKAIWRPSRTSSGCLYSTGTSLLHVLQWSIVLPNRPPPASTLAWCHNVEADWAPGMFYTGISSCDSPRISFAFRLRAPNLFPNAIVVVCRCRWRTSMEATTAQSCVRGDGRESVNIRLLCVPSRPSSTSLCVTRNRWKGWKFSSTWGGSLPAMMPIPRPCRVICKRHEGAGRESPVCCGLKTLPPGRAECSTRQPCRQFCCMEVKLGICHHQA
jgi:hypothetical protein